MKATFEITREEAETVVRQLMKEWVPHDDQKVIFNLVRRLQEELSEE